MLEQVHGLVIKSSMDSYAVVSNALLSAYSSCFTVSVSERLFCDLPVKDLVSWNTNISAFARSGTPERALELFNRMLLAGVLPNENTIASVLVACIGVNSPAYGELIHAKAIKHNLSSSSVYVGSSLVDFYAKCKRLEDAHNMFREIPDKNVVMWNALISGYSNKDSSALPVLLKEMLQSGFRPNEFTYSSILRNAAALTLWQIHSLIIRMGYENNDYVSSALIASYDAHDMISDALACTQASVCPVHVAPCNVVAGIYNRMGRYEDTKEMLLQLQYRDTISWNILVTACARNGDYSEAFQLFKRMQIAGYLLDNYMAVSLLSICSKSNSLGLVCIASRAYY
nr:pentatricopeptide repeat protein AaPPR289 [Agave angustifolia]UPT49501.1 pentatricopeptide repeat protein AaPPR670 [Agave angustifolia]